MSHILLRGASTILTMDDAGRELTGQDIRLRDGVIADIGAGLPTEGAEVVHAAGCIVTPGLVNTHHHLYQTLTRAVPAGQDALLFGWLRALYPIWARYTPEDVHIATLCGLGELALSGCTTSSDHSTSSRTARGLTTRSRRRPRSGCASTRHAVPCR